jgi:alkylated DNA repair protein alkB family protein 8
VPTNNIFIYHYGNGDEDDQIGLVNYFKQKCRIHIFPGISYGFIEFETIPNYELKDNTASIDINFPQGVRNVLLLYSKVSINEVKLHSNSNFPVAKLTHSIPGLIIINDFISEEEEKQLIENIDKEEWKKLTNRRVQHYGYEFVYGANNIDKTKKIGALPDFNIGLNKSKNRIDK